MLVAVGSAAAFTVTFLVALHTDRGISVDRAAFARVSGDAPAPFQVAGQRTLRTIDVATVAAALLVLVLLGLARGELGRAIAAGAVVALSIGTTEALKHGLPHLAGAVPAGRPPTFPSGHTAVAVSLGLALVLAAPPLLRPTAALAGAAYGAAIAFSVVVLGWHYPSDSVGSFFVCSFWAALIAARLRTQGEATSVSPRGLAVAAGAVAAALVAAAALASRHPTAVATARSQPALVAAAVSYGLLSLGVFSALTPLIGGRPRE